MIKCSSIGRWILVGIIPVSLLSGCGTVEPHSKTGTPYNAFIQYWSPAKDTKGLRLAVKDLIDMKGLVTTAGCQYIAETSPPAKRDAACLATARERKVIFVGKTNLSELAVAPSGLNTYYGTPQNPITKRRRRIPGGSSSGSAVAVATGLADVALGTDTTGSIRLPAACCGVVGLKTTFGLVPLKGVYPIEAVHLDTVGPLAKDIAHEVEGMDLLENGFASRYRAAMSAKPSGKQIRIGRLYLGGTNARIDTAVDAALRAGQFQVIPLDKEFTKKWDQAVADGTAMAASGAWMSDLKFRDKQHVSVRTKTIVALGELNYKINYDNALSRQGQWQAALRGVFKQVDFIALPTMQNLPPKVPRLGGTPLFEAAALRLENTCAVNFAGNPALAVPIPVKDPAVPLTSLQLIGPKLSEAALLNAGRLVEATQPEARRLVEMDQPRKVE